MRKDHHKVLCERPRRGHKNKHHDYRHVKGTAINDECFDDFEEDDKNIETQKLSEPMQRPYKQYYAEKEYSDMTSGIRGYVRKNVGRKWDDVFSEFCAQYDQRSVLTKHLYEHMKNYVCTKVVERDGKLVVQSGYRVISLESSFEQYYVGPNDGILKLNPYYVSWKQIRNKYNKPKPNKTNTRCVVDNFHEYHLLNGVWFLITFIELPGKRVQVKHVSSYSNRVIYYSATEYPKKYDILKQEVVDGQRYAASKRTASKKEIRNFKLNEPIEDMLAA